MADHLEHLRTVSLFRGVTDAELAEIAKVTTELELDAGTVMATQGTSAREAFVIISGTAEVTVDGQKVADVGPGSCVGEVALLDSGTRSATVTAATPMRVLVLDPREFHSLLLTVPSITVKVAAALAAMVRELDAKLYG
jgi:CRP/FNR family transcriptional regulator, cyclic AMP receptor protein